MASRLDFGDLDALAGATVCGHLLECGAQTTGGNFSLYADLLDAPGADPGMLDHVAFPLAEVADDGSCVITKHPGTGGAVTVATVTEQLLYECTGTSYGGPDVVSLFDTVRLEQAGPDRVTVRGVQGLPPGDWLKVSTNRIGGFRTSMTVPLTGLDIERKAALLQRQLADALDAAAEVTVTLARTDRADAAAAERKPAPCCISPSRTGTGQGRPRVLGTGRGQRAVQHSRLLRHVAAGRGGAVRGVRAGLGPARCGPGGRRDRRGAALEWTPRPGRDARPRPRSALGRCST